MAKTLYFPPPNRHEKDDCEYCVQCGDKLVEVEFLDSGSLSHDDKTAFKKDIPDGYHKKGKIGHYFEADSKPHKIKATFIDSKGNLYVKTIKIQTAPCP
jgi:hypothetical protein